MDREHVTSDLLFIAQNIVVKLTMKCTKKDAQRGKVCVIGTDFRVFSERR